MRAGLILLILALVGPPVPLEAGQAQMGAVSSAPADGFHARVVREIDDTPVADAEVSIVGLSGTARTDADGRFSWTPAPPVPFQVVVVLVDGQVARPFRVERIRQALMTIAVSGFTETTMAVLGSAPGISATPGSGTTLLSGGQIAIRAPEHLTQALETVPGMSQVSEGRAAVPAMRGLARGRTLLLIDGARVTSERRVGPSATFLDPSSLGSIEVARGPGSVAYGSDALGGVIAVRTRRAEPGSPWRLRFSTAAGIGEPQARGAFEIAKGLGRGGVLVQAHARGAGDYRAPEADVFNSGWQDRGLLASVTHAVGDGMFAMAWQSDFARDVERPRNDSQVVRFFYPFETSHRLTTSYERPAAAGFEHLSVMAFFGASDQRTDQDRFATPTTGRSLERADVSARDFQVRASGRRPLSGVRLEVGVDLNGRYGLEALDSSQQYTPAGSLLEQSSTVSIENARRLAVGIFGQLSGLLAPRALASGGMRVDRVTTANRGGHFGSHATSHAAVSGFGAITLGPFRRLNVTAQLARGFRDPMLSDRYYRGPSGRGFITGNPALEPETSLQLDVAARYDGGPVQLAAYGYRYRIDDLVERYSIGDDSFAFRNRGRAVLRGVELEAQAGFAAGYSLEASAQLTDGATADGEALDDISPATIALAGRKDWGDRAYGHLRVSFRARDTRPGPTEVRAPGATLVDVGGGWLVGRGLELRGLVRNLLDAAYYASPDPRWVLAPGRSASVTAVVTVPAP